MSLMRAGKWAGSAAVIAAALAGWSAEASAGTVTIQSQERFVSASVDGGVEVNDQSQRFDATDTGPFNATARAATPTGGLASASTAASMTSSFSNDLLEVRGSLRFDLQDARQEDDFVSADSIFFARVFFSIDEDYNFKFRNVSDDTGSTVNGISDSDMRLTNVEDPGNTFQPGASGLLNAGRYELLLAREAKGSSTDPLASSFLETFDYSLELSEADGGVQAIPLPPAVWSGLAVFGIGALKRLRKYRLA